MNHAQNNDFSSFWYKRRELETALLKYLLTTGPNATPFARVRVFRVSVYLSRNSPGVIIGCLFAAEL